VHSRCLGCSNVKYPAQVRVTYLELYNEQLRDLLDPKAPNLQLKEHPEKGVYIPNQQTVSSCLASVASDMFVLSLTGCY
jgi:Kinesin motor domain